MDTFKVSNLQVFLGLQAFPSFQPFQVVLCLLAFPQVQVDQVCLALLILLSLHEALWHQEALSDLEGQQDLLCRVFQDHPSLLEVHLRHDHQQDPLGQEVLVNLYLQDDLVDLAGLVFLEDRLHQCLLWAPRVQAYQGTQEDHVDHLDLLIHQNP